MSDPQDRDKALFAWSLVMLGELLVVTGIFLVTDARDIGLFLGVLSFILACGLLSILIRRSIQTRNHS
jgi:hypothetical protein